MANNRLYLKCDICGQVKCLLKYFSSWRFASFAPGEPASQNDEMRVGSLDDWLDEHIHGNYDSIGPTHFSLEYETKE